MIETDAGLGDEPTVVKFQPFCFQQEGTAEHRFGQPFLLVTETAVRHSTSGISPSAALMIGGLRVGTTPEQRPILATSFSNQA